MNKNIAFIINISIFIVLGFFAAPVLALEVINPFTGSATGGVSLISLSGRIIKAALGIVGVLVLVFFVWGGFMWMTSAGNQEKVKQGRDTLMWSALGLAAIFSSYAILNLVIETLSRSTYK